MVSSNKRYEGYWYIRDLDFLPQSLEYYPYRVTKKLLLENGEHIVVYDNLEKAQIMSNKIRKLVGLDEYDFHTSNK